MMTPTQYKSSGISLIAGSFLMIATMVLHPSGGSIEHILEIYTVAIVSHSLAILSIPFLLFGFWGISRRLNQSYFLSMTAFTTICTGMMAVMIAAALNGLVLPMYIKSYENASSETLELVKHILRYGSTLNHAFDYIFIGSFCLAVLFWSIAILKTKALPVFLAYLGIIYALICFILSLVGFHFIDLQEFRIYIFGSVIWILLAAFLLTQIKEEADVS